MKYSSPFFLLLAAGSTASSVWAFVPSDAQRYAKSRAFASVPLNAIGALAKKAKQADLRKYVEGGIEDSVMEKYNVLKEALEKDTIDLNLSTPGPLQQALTKRKGTITIIAEFRRKNDAIEAGYIADIYDPEMLSPAFREYGASAVAVMADERMGGCTYKDLADFVEEQRRAKNEVPGPIAVINNDLIIDELQIARSAAMGVTGCVLTLDVLGDQLETLLKATKAVDMEPIVAVSNKEEAQQAIDLGARIILIVCLEDVEAKAEIITDLSIPDGQQVCMLANILTRKNQQLQEIEDAWFLRDKGFNSVWVGDALYKAGQDANEHPGAVIKAMRSKSSLKWASPKARTGKGEGAREYLGDIMM
ncbi:Indole-3-glycerol phosphate synthase [Seminavis robusta]|uniref:indole-3-glycerol-phosphate synthase n=1 Tax=Seminavis robusta TaxID=568900 RepID=A0A9N8DVG8_9STRA|nr:Indole-3-glycerol phosphate synthase [Seminavis robusta]|eukprot:Sro323_g117350.1 Indole-3-glycerol phosphate synthase (362) ;mRNA; r:49533-50618